MIREQVPNQLTRLACACAWWPPVARIARISKFRVMAYLQQV